AGLTAWWTATRSWRLRTAFGRPQTITGRFTTPAGAPIGGAKIDVVAIPAVTGAVAAIMPSPYTDQEGRFVGRRPRGLCSRTLQFQYRAHVGDPAPVAAGNLALDVNAGLALSI